MALLSAITEIWNKATHSRSVIFPSFRIPDCRNLDNNTETDPFKANEAYFEIRLSEQFLKDKREYWSEYNPLTIVLTEFIYDNDRKNFPFIIGPGLLNSIGQLDGDERIRYKNTRVVGPVPYVGDDITLFLGLFRVKTKDWSRQALGLLETVARVFDSSKLTSYINISAPLTEGIESFFEMGDQIQFRLGQRISFSDPVTNTINCFSPGYFVIIRSEQSNIDQSKFWIKNDQLYYGTKKRNLKLYRDNDYLLYNITKNAVRNDYTTFDFHKKFTDVQKLIWENNLDKAAEIFPGILLDIRSGTDLIDQQKNQLTVFYTTRFEEERSAFEASQKPLAKSGKAKNNENIFTHIINGNNKYNLGREALDFLKISNDIYKSGSCLKNKPDHPLMIDNNQIKSMLTSPMYNKPELLKINPDIATSTATTISQISILKKC